MIINRRKRETICGNFETKKMVFIYIFVARTSA